MDDEGEEESDENDGYEAGGAQGTTPGGGEHTVEGHSEGPQGPPNTPQLPR